MQFHKLIINVTLATLALSATRCAATAELQPATYASTRDDSITKQIGLQIAQLGAIQPRPQAASSAINQEGQTFFSHPPQLIRVAAVQTGVFIPSTYKFTLTVPKDAGQSLRAVKVAQAENVETVKFNVGNSKAFFGDRLTASTEIRLASVGSEQPSNPGEVTIVFEQPVPPGSTVTVALAVQRNPNQGGVYLFGVTAYPVGENGLGQFLGYGRINFYGNSN